MGHIRVNVCLCEMCGHSWLSKEETLPARCAKCKSSTWDGQEKRDRGRPARMPAPIETLEDTGPEISSDDVPEEYLPNDSQLPADVPEDKDVVEETITRRMGHVRCDCVACENLRRMMRPSPETGTRLAHEKTPRKKGKKTAGR